MYTNISENYIISQDGLKIPYYVQGDGYPMCFFNGFTCRQDNLKYLIQHFSKNYKIITWDYKGHGNNPMPENYNYCSINSFVWDAQRIFDELNIQNVILVGYSIGTELMYEFALKNPKKTRLIISINGLTGNVANSLFHTNLFKHALEFLKRSSPYLSDIYNKTWTIINQAPFSWKYLFASPFIDKAKLNKDDMVPFINGLSQMKADFLIHLLDEFHKHSVLNDLLFLEQPTLLLAGEKDHFVPYNCSLEAHRKIPHSEFVKIPGGTHNMNMEQYEKLIQEMEIFINKNKYSL